ncbi:MAG: co-chaperone GroES [Mobilicoccus sp.]|nr:co-chaperone GroES [Mobilicoccus sp.]
MLGDRVLLQHDDAEGERQTGGGLLIPATASLGKRLAWAVVVATGQHVRQVKLDDHALFDPSDLAEVELDGKSYVLARERDLHAVRAPAAGSDGTGLYL